MNLPDQLSFELTEHNQLNSRKETKDVPKVSMAINDFIGAVELLKQYPFLNNNSLPHLILTGPPGSGKTTFAKILAEKNNFTFIIFSAVSDGISELRKTVDNVFKRSLNKERIVFFIDEIHRLNRQAQDVLLPYLEKRDFVFIGATTESPKTSLCEALFSRIRVVRLPAHPPEQIIKILENFFLKQKSEVQMGPELKEKIELIAKYCHGDARVALNSFTLILKSPDLYPPKKIIELLIEHARPYDKAGDQHYDIISAFIKSLRGSDPNAAIFWLAVMLDGGENIEFIARRMLIFAAEDIGNADPQALILANTNLSAIKHVGMPEASIILAQTSIYLASTVKSNSAYNAIKSAQKFLSDGHFQRVPDHLKQFNKTEDKYLYPHDFSNHFVKQKYTSKEIPNFVKFEEVGWEKKFKQLFESRWQKADHSNQDL